MAPFVDGELPDCVATEANWRQMACWMINRCGLGFHPDTDIMEYISTETGRPLFEPDLAGRILQPLLDQARAVIPENRLCDIAFELMRERYPEIGADYR